jgi:GxxExxY protein
MTLPAGQARDPETDAVIGCAMRVHRELGPGFYEQVYKEAMKVEFSREGIAFRTEVDLPIYYSGVLLPCMYRADFICFERLLLETKAIRELTNGNRAQTIHYLMATRFERGLLLNFGAASLEYERLIDSRNPSA